jgi:hypothetical protein
MSSRPLGNVKIGGRPGQEKRCSRRSKLGNRGITTGYIMALLASATKLLKTLSNIPGGPSLVQHVNGTAPAKHATTLSYATWYVHPLPMHTTLGPVRHR